MARREGRMCWHGRCFGSLRVKPGLAWRIGLLAIVMQHSPSAAAMVGLEQFKFPNGTVHESLGDDMRLYGLPVQIRVFDAPLGVPALIRALSDQQPGLADLRVLPGQAILSGMVNESLWLVQMEGLSEKRSVGSISILPVSPVIVRSPPLPAWLPPGARLRFAFSVLEGSQRVTDDIWTHSLPPKQLRPLIHRNLAARGWTAQSSAHEESVWRRKERRMRVDIYAVGAGSGVRAQRVLP